MSQYETSTQLSDWLLSPALLSTRRTAANESARSSRPPSTPPTSFLSLSEEDVLLQYHQRRIQHFVSRLKCPEKVSATAITYFKRFYIDHSIMDYDPAAIALSSLYAAFKVEEVYTTAEYLVQTIDQHDASEGSLCERVHVGVVLGIELEFLQSLKFHLICFHPFRCMGILREVLRGVHGEGTEGEDRLGRMMYRAESLLRKKVYLSDLLLTQTPGVLATAAVIAAMEDAGGNGDMVWEKVGGRADVVAEVDEKVKRSVEVIVEELRAQEEAKEGVLVKGVEEKRMKLPRVDNFLTRCERAVHEDLNLDNVDKEERAHAREARRKHEEILGAENANALYGGAAKKIKLQSH